MRYGTGYKNTGVLPGYAKSCVYLLFIMGTVDNKLDQLRKTVRTGNTGSVVRALLQLSEHHNRERNKQAFTYARKALQLAIKTDDKAMIAKAHLQLAIYFCRLRNDYTTSLNHCEKALYFKNTFEKHRDLSEIFKTMGVNYYYLTELQKSQESYKNALDLLLSNQDKSNEELKYIADLYYNLAILNRRPENIHLRKENLEKALAFYDEINYSNGVARCYDGMAVYYFYQKDYKQALARMKAALEKFEQINDTEGIYLTCNNIGTLKIQQGKFEEGLSYLHRSLDLRKKGRNPVSIAISYINIGNALSDRKRYKEALTNLKHAEKILRNTKSKIELATLLSAMSKCYECMEQYEKALACQTEYASLREDLHRHEMEKAYNDTIVRYDVELAEKNAVIDRLRNFELASYIHRFEMSNNELKQFANAASHDLKEPLRTISSFVNLLEKHLKKNADPTTVEYLNFITGATHRLDGLVKDMLSLSKIDFSETPLTEVDLNNTFTAVIESISAWLNERNATVKTGKLPVIIADRMQMFQLFQNLIVNAVKYNESKDPHVKISARKNKKQVHLSFADNGIGIPDEYHKKVFELFQRLHPREKYSGTGLGLTLSKKIVTRHRGKIWVEKNKPSGTIFHVTIPQ